MKTSHRQPSPLALTASIATLLPVLALLGSTRIVKAADSTWTGATNGLWTTATNWTAGLPNGSTGTFNNNVNTAVTVGSAQGLFNLNFETPSVGNFTFSGSQFTFAGNGTGININANVTTSPTITLNNNVQFGIGATPRSLGVTTNTGNGAGTSIVFNGNVFGGQTAAALSDFLNVRIVTGTFATFYGVISDGGVGKLVVTKTGGGGGTLTLANANTYTGGTEYGSDSGNIVIGNKAAFGTGAIRIRGFANAGALSASTPLTGANAIANNINYISASTGTATTMNAVFTLTAGSNVATLFSGTAPAVGDLITTATNSNPNLPSYTRVTGVSGATITFDQNAVTTGNTAVFSTAPYNASGAGTTNIGGTNAIEFSGTQNLTSIYSNLGTATQIFNIGNSADTTFSGILQQTGGVASLTKTGAGRLILSGTNTYTGGTNINVGTVQVASAGALGLTGTILFGTAANNGTLQFGSGITTDFSSRFGTTANQNFNIDTNSNNVTFASQVSPSSGGTFTKLGSGTLAIGGTNANTLTGVTTIIAGTLQIGTGSTTGKLSTASAIVNNGVLVINRSNAVTQGTDFSGAAITGSGSFVNSGGGTSGGVVTTLNAANTYSGTTTIENGFVNVGGNSVLSGVPGPLGQASIAIVLGNANTLASTAGGGGPNVILAVKGSGAATQNFTIDRAIDSSATADLVGRTNIRYINDTAGASGTLTVSGDWTLGNTSAHGYGLAAQQVGQTLDYTGKILGGASGSTFRINDYGQGSGSIRLSNALNAYAGQTNITQGTLLIAGDALSGSGVLGTNATLQIAEGGNNVGTPTGAYTDGAFTVAKTVTLSDNSTLGSAYNLGGNAAAVSGFTGNVNTAATVNSRTLNLSQVAGGTVTFSGIIGANSNATGATSVNKIGAGTVFLTRDNTYDGTTTVAAGMLVIAGNQIASGPISGQFLVNNAGILQFGDGTSTNGSAVAAGTISVNNTGMVAVNKTNGGTVTNQIASNPGATTTLSGLNAASTTNSFTSTLYNNGGGFVTNSNNAGAILAFTGGTAGVDGALDLKGTTLVVGGAGDTLIGGLGKGIDNSTGSGAVTKVGSGTLIYQADNTYTGTTAIDAGTVRVDTAQTNSGMYFVGNGGTLGTAASLILGGGGSGLTGGVTFNRTVSINPGNGANRTIGGTNTSNTNVFSGLVQLDGVSPENRSVNVTAATNGTVNFTNVISGAGQAVTKTGAGTVAFFNANTYSGGTTINEGTLVAGNDSAFGGQSVTFSGGALASDDATRSLANNLMVSNVANNRITGSNDLTLTGNASGAGTLEIALTDSTKTVTVNPGTTDGFAPAGIKVTSGTLLLGGSEKIGNATDLTLSGGTFNTGGYSESLGNLTLTADSTIDFGAGNTSLLTFTGGTWESGTLTILNWNGVPAMPGPGAGEDQLIFNPNAISQAFLDHIAFDGYGIGAVQFDRGSGSFEVVPVPEPGTVFGALALLGLVGYRERRRFAGLFAR